MFENLPVDPVTLALLAPAFFVVAVAYSSVGLGGGTGYLAIMTLTGIHNELLPSTALLMNLVVTGLALTRFGLSGNFRWRVLVPFLLPALPAAFVGGLLDPPDQAFKMALGVALLIVAAAMIFSVRSTDDIRTPSSLQLWSVGIPLGAGIGFLSGFLGVGGGVFLGPVVLLLAWAGPRETAPMCSMMILLVSASGLISHGMKGHVEPGLVIPLAVAVAAGGLLGTYLGIKRLTPTTLKRVFSVIVLLAGLKSILSAL